MIELLIRGLENTENQASGKLQKGHKIERFGVFLFDEEEAKGRSYISLLLLEFVQLILCSAGNSLTSSRKLDFCG